VGTVTVSAADLSSWLQVRNVDLAVQILTKQGVQGVVKSSDGSTVNLEHAWVEAYVPFDRYRGTSSSGCAAAPTNGCAWVALDPSFKRYAMKASPIDIYDVLPFDYTSYYNAIKNQDAARMNKNPLEIYQGQILSHLQANYPGKTLADVRDNGQLVSQADGVLPASLPYTVVGLVKRYNSVAEHDAAVGAGELKKWGMQVTVTVQTETRDTSGAPTFDLYGNPVPSTTLISVRPYYLSDLTTKRLTLSFGRSAQGCTVSGSNVCAVLRLDGVADYRSSASATSSDIFIIQLKLDGAPATVAGGVDQVITATYYNNISNGYFLIGTGGETSNWSQAHRASERLLAASNPGGSTGTTDPVLVDEVTGGLLQTAMSLYYAKFRDAIGELNALNHVASPINGFVGVVSSVYDLEYYDGTAFGVLPGGLLIDMKGQNFAGTWRNNAANTTAPNHFLLLGHATSSLEHEIWQELTGFDAVSTVRGVQMAMAQSGAQMVNPKNLPSNNLSTELPKFGLSNSSPLITQTFNLANIFFSPRTEVPQTWHASDYYINTTIPQGAAWNLSFGALKKTVQTSDPSWRKATINYTYYSDYNSVYDWLSCYEKHHRGLYYAGQYYPNPDGGSSYPGNTILNHNSRYATYTCGGTYIVGYPYDETNYVNGHLDSLWHQERAEFLSFLNANSTYWTYINTSGSYPFVLTDFVYRNASANPNLQTLGVIASIRDNLALSQKLEYLIPSQRTLTDYNQFMVYVAKGYDSAGTTLQALSFQIQNWGGGFVSAEPPSPSIEPLRR